MNLREYINTIESLVAKHPEALEFEVMFASDDEGNCYNFNVCKPSLMYCRASKSYGETDEVYDVDDYNAEYGETVTANCVIIN